MPESDTTVEAVTPSEEPVEIVREEPVDVTAEVVVIDDEDDEDDDDHARTIVLRQVLERQLVAGQAVSMDVVEAATDATIAVAHAPAGLVDEIRGGATLPTALSRTGTAVREVVVDAGGRLRSSVGGYVGAQATLPNAVISGAADVAESVVRAQGDVAASAINAAFAVATTAAQGGDLRASFANERSEIATTAGDARDRVEASVTRARTGIQAAIKDYDALVAAFDD
jgi:hypothetical protein